MRVNLAEPCLSSDMGLASGGKVKQEIYADPFNFNDRDFNTSNRYEEGFTQLPAEKLCLKLSASR